MTSSNDSSTPTPTMQLQVVDESQQFTESLPQAMKSDWKLWEAGFDYNLVAVFGSQSTGKSTLLNKLFLTSFDVMSETARRQTTKGIWMSQARTPDPEGSNATPNGILVMDVEGTDGRERGEDQDFERKSALFSVAVAQVIIVNMWENMVGLYNGANMGLLKTVFEVNLTLFHGNVAGRDEIKTKTLLMFVIRDHIGVTPLDDLSNTLKADLERIWKGLSKPKGLEECAITDFFDFMFTALPHKVLMTEQFNQSADALRLRFTDKNNENYVFRPNFHKRIPADGFPHYASSIWTKILSNKDLDLPTQQELLAQYRCDEIASAAFTKFTDAVKGCKSPIESGKIIDDLGEITSAARNDLIRTFDRDASRYHAEVYKRKRSEVLRSANAMLISFFLGQLKNLSKKALYMFTNGLNSRLVNVSGSSGSLKEGFMHHVRSARILAEEYFLESARAICLPDTDWSYAEQLSQLSEEIEDIANRRKGEEMGKMVVSLKKYVVQEITDPITMHLNKPSPEMWQRVIRDYGHAYEKAKQKLVSRAENEFDAGEADIGSSISSLQRQSWGILMKRVAEETADSMMMVKLRNRFEERFRYDENGLPRVWKPEDDIDGAYRRARDEALKLVPLFSKIDANIRELGMEVTEDFDPEQNVILLTEPKQQDLISRFRKDADATYVDAKRSVVSTTARIPVWVMGLLVVLGWNEMWTLISNPLYLFTFVIFGSAAYVIWALNLQGPVQRVAQVVVSEGTKMVQERMKEAQTMGTAAGKKYAQQKRSNSTYWESGASKDDDGEESDDVGVLKRSQRLGNADESADAAGRRRRVFLSEPSSLNLDTETIQ